MNSNTDNSSVKSGADAPHSKAAGAADAGASTRRRKYSPRISKKSAAGKNTFVALKEAELRDARMLDRLLAEISDLSPWGLGVLKAKVKDLGPVQEDLLPGTDPVQSQ